MARMFREDFDAEADTFMHIKPRQEEPTVSIADIIVSA
jgi:hypothetical protein